VARIGIGPISTGPVTADSREALWNALYAQDGKNMLFLNNSDIQALISALMKALLEISQERSSSEGKHTIV
jgi:hypothetical protein